MNATAPRPIQGRLPPHRVLPEPLLKFGSGADSVGPHPLRGLLTNGPYSRGAFGHEPVRIAIVTTQALLPRLRSFLSSLRDEHQPSDRKKYVPTYPGFQQIFGVDLVPAGDGATALLNADLPSAADPHAAISSALSAAVRRLSAVQPTWDVSMSTRLGPTVAA